MMKQYRNSPNCWVLHWAGQKFIKVAKSPLSPPIAFPFIVDASGILLLSDDGIPVSGSEINSIRSQGFNYVKLFYMFLLLIIN